MNDVQNIQNQILDKMTKAETDAKKIRDLEDSVNRLRAEVLEFIRAEEVLIAAGLLTKVKVEQAHDIVRQAYRKQP